MRMATQTMMVTLERLPLMATKRLRYAIQSSSLPVEVAGLCTVPEKVCVYGCYLYHTAVWQ